MEPNRRKANPAGGWMENKYDHGGDGWRVTGGGKKKEVSRFFRARNNM